MKPDFTGKELSREIKNINKIIIHCSDSDIPAHDDISVIKQWHLARGFEDVGYHFFVKKNGIVQTGRPMHTIGAHCVNQNLTSIGVCVSGKTDFKVTQFIHTRELCEALMDRYKIKEADIYPHCHFNKNKTCPNFNLEKLRTYATIHCYFKFEKGNL
jgi:N-acetyl-anhydromuramyl-L-alanine amidase AmpD